MCGGVTSFRGRHKEPGRPEQQRQDQHDKGDDDGLGRAYPERGISLQQTDQIAAAIEPARFPMPPITTTMKALRIQSSPIAWFTPTSGPNSTPLAPAMAAPMANTTVSTQGTGIPIAW